MYKKQSVFKKIKNIFQFDDTFFEDEEGFSIETENTQKRKSFFDQDDEEETTEEKKEIFFPELSNPEKEIWEQNEDLYGELSVDVYETNDQMIIQSMIAGVKPESLEITISRDMVMIKGKREDSRKINEDQFSIKELYWGSFARTIQLDQEIDPDLAEAVEKYGLLTLKLPKIDRAKQTTVKIKSI